MVLNLIKKYCLLVFLLIIQCNNNNEKSYYIYYNKDFNGEKLKYLHGSLDILYNEKVYKAKFVYVFNIREKKLLLYKSFISEKKIKNIRYYSFDVKYLKKNNIWNVDTSIKFSLNNVIFNKRKNIDCLVLKHRIFLFDNKIFIKDLTNEENEVFFEKIKSTNNLKYKYYLK